MADSRDLQTRLNQILGNETNTAIPASLHERQEKKEKVNLSKYFLIMCIVICPAFMFFRMQKIDMTKKNFYEPDTRFEEIDDNQEEQKDVFFQEF